MTPLRVLESVKPKLSAYQKGKARKAVAAPATEEEGEEVDGFSQVDSGAALVSRLISTEEALLQELLKKEEQALRSKRSGVAAKPTPPGEFVRGVFLPELLKRSVRHVSRLESMGRKRALLVHRSARNFEPFPATNTIQAASGPPLFRRGWNLCRPLATQDTQGSSAVSRHPLQQRGVSDERALCQHSTEALARPSGKAPTAREVPPARHGQGNAAGFYRSFFERSGVDRH
eukprot:GSA120T00002532001.1